jgi:hypothetical protein
MRDIPFSEIAKWPPPNYAHPQETHGNGLIVVDVIFLVLTTIVVILRIYSRLRVQIWAGVDDVFIVIALVSLVSFAYKQLRFETVRFLLLPVYNFAKRSWTAHGYWHEHHRRARSDKIWMEQTHVGRSFNRTERLASSALRLLLARY